MIELLYKNEHFSCFNYQKQKTLPIQGKKINAGEYWGEKLTENSIFFVIQGTAKLICNNTEPIEIEKQQMFVVMQNTDYKLCAYEDVFLIIVNIQNPVNLCECFPLDQLYAEKSENSQKLNILSTNKKLLQYLDTTYDYISDGLCCYYFFEIKIKELFLMLKAYYPKHELALFFHALLEIDQSFPQFVFDHYRVVKNAQQLAELSPYSISTFNKHFKNYFGISTYQWMNKQRARFIFREINESQKPFKEISDQYGFLSLPQFNTFCKTHFKMSPGQIRKKDEIVDNDN